LLGSSPWPETLLGQVRGYAARRTHFEADDADALAAYLGVRSPRISVGASASSSRSTARTR
jgi:hypothetical protein